MRILNLVLYSQTQNCYEHMKSIIDHYYKQNGNNIRTIFYKYSNIESDFLLNDNILHIKGQESFVPGILNKTIKAFEFILQTGIVEEYDYIIRSNISTIINFDLLIKDLENTPLQYYGGGLIHTLKWKDKNAGIVDDQYFGTAFANGTSIMMTKDALEYLINNKELINHNIVDDVAIGIFFMEHKSDCYPPQEIGSYKFKTMNKNYNSTEDIQELKNIVKSNSVIFYRNRWGDRDRMIDIFHMKMITTFLQG